MTSITKHTKSLKTYAYSVLFAHLGALTYFYPGLVFGFIFTIATFIILFLWVDLTYKIEQQNRDNLIILINATENETTKSILLNELWLNDLHSLGGLNLEHDYRI
tara:strand:+ start:210 stop:524 length:315 start_codon:yes stop_codon:yes gene_type:complete